MPSPGPPLIISERACWVACLLGRIRGPARPPGSGYNPERPRKYSSSVSLHHDRWRSSESRVTKGAGKMAVTRTEGRGVCCLGNNEPVESDDPGDDDPVQIRRLPSSLASWAPGGRATQLKQLHNIMAFFKSSSQPRLSLSGRVPASPPATRDSPSPGRVNLTP